MSVLIYINGCLGVFSVICDMFCSILTFLLQTYFSPLTCSSWTFSMAFWQRCQWLTLCSVYALNVCSVQVSCVLELMDWCLSVFYTIYNIFCYVLSFILQIYFSPLTCSSWTFSMAFDSVVSGLLYVKFMLWICVLVKF